MRPLLVRLYETGSSASREWERYWVAFLIDGAGQSQGIGSGGSIRGAIKDARRDMDRAALADAVRKGGGE